MPRVIGEILMEAGLGIYNVRDAVCRTLAGIVGKTCQADYCCDSFKVGDKDEAMG